jgi:hypothetical protein
MLTIKPRILTADLWNADGRLGKTLDALFSYGDREISGLVMGFHHTEGINITTGPAQIVSCRDSNIRLFEDLPADDGLAASIGRAIQAVFSASHLNDYLDNIQDDCPVSEEGETLQAMFTPSGLFLYQDDPWQVLENHPSDTDCRVIAAQLCTIVLKPAGSAHEAVKRSQDVLAECHTYYQIQKNGLDLLKAQKAAAFTLPSAADITKVLQS